MKRFLLAAAALAVSTPALAQQVPAAPPVLVQTNPQDADQAARTALVRRYFAAIQFDKLMNGMIESLLQNVLADDRIPDDKREVVRNVAIESFEAVLPGYMDRVVAVYADAFTQEELAGVVGFYESPIGQSLTAKSVMLTRRTGELLEYFQPAFDAEMHRRLCDRIGCGPEVVPTAKR